jgi:plastocyanin
MRHALLIAVLALALAGPAFAQDPTKIDVTIKDHRFTPAEIQVPAGKTVLLIVKNADDTVEEFDSSALHVEKVIIGGRTGEVWLRPLAPGRYPFMGEYHAATAKGVVIAK